MPSLGSDLVYRSVLQEGVRTVQRSVVSLFLTVFLLSCSSLNPSGPSVGFYDESNLDIHSPYRQTASNPKAEPKAPRLEETQAPQQRYAPPAIEPGMDRYEVKSIYGEPTRIDYAGDPSYGNERWFYASPYSLSLSKSGSKLVYFEMGRVVGWENP